MEPPFLTVGILMALAPLRGQSAAPQAVRGPGFFTREREDIDGRTGTTKKAEIGPFAIIRNKRAAQILMILCGSGSINNHQADLQRWTSTS